MDDATRESDACKNSYDRSRRAVLRSHPWNCAVTRVILAPLSTVPAFGFSHQFQLPSDCLRLIDLDEGEDQDFKIEGKTILSDETSLDVRYIRDVTISSDMDVLLAEAIACYIAWDISYAVTQSNDVRDEMWTAFQKLVRTSKTVDAQEDAISLLEANQWVDSRIAGSTANQMRDYTP